MAALFYRTVRDKRTTFFIKLLLFDALMFVVIAENTQAELIFEAAFQGECRSNGPCQHLCFDLHDGTFECACKQGYTLSDNGYSCIENHLLEERINETRFENDVKEQSNEMMREESNKENGNDPIYYSCAGIECEAGGSCVVDENHTDNRVRCRCPLARGGFFCEKPMEVRFPRFRGRSYLALPTLRDAHKSMKVNIEFKPEYYEGILLYSGERQNLDGDFIAIVLNQGFVEFRFDCGMGEGVIRSDRPVVLRSWNTLTIYRDGWAAWMQLNNQQKVSGQSQGLFSRITFRLELFLGGSPNLTLISPRTKAYTGFEGCVRNLKINGHLYDFRSDNRGDAIDGVDIEECNADVCSHTLCLNGGQCVAKSPDKGICLCPLGFAGTQCEIESDFTIPSFNGSSYLQFPGLAKNALSFVEIKVIFKTRASNGLLLYNGNRMDGSGDFLAINLVDGYVEFRFDLGTGPAIIRSLMPVTLNEWHTLLVSRTGRKGVLEIDDQPGVEDYSRGAFTQLSLPLNLFIGGVSDMKDVSQSSDVTQSFVGCIQKVTINGRNLQLLEEALSGVNVVDCPHPCISQPCFQGGRCEPQLEYYTCHCPLGFVGTKCEKEVDEMISIPMFYGNSFLHYLDEQIMKRVRGNKVDIRLRFRAFSPEGVILWSGEREVTGFSDYMSLGLKRGLLRFSFNLGSGETHLVYNLSRLDDGRWHQVHVSRHKRDAMLVVDNESPIVGSSPETQIQLNVNYGLFLGGVEDVTLQTRHKFRKGIIGCVSHLTLATDYHIRLITQATRGVNIRPCI